MIGGLRYNALKMVGKQNPYIVAMEEKRHHARLAPRRHVQRQELGARNAVKASAGQFRQK